MARIAGINIPMNKHVVVGLTHIFGIGNSRAARICDAAGRALRVEIEPGRYYVAPTCTLVTRVSDVKSTRPNAKGSGAKFVRNHSNGVTRSAARSVCWTA